MPYLSLFVILAYALYEGFVHSFEADHVLAVSNIVSQRGRIILAIKDGIFWGLGHTSTIFLIGVIMILFRVQTSDVLFSYFEAVVGLMLVVVSVFRFYLFWSRELPVFGVHRHDDCEHDGMNDQLHTHIHLDGKHLHKTSYGIGIIHGLAGSGGLVILIMAQIQTVISSLLFLVFFGVGSMLGMAIVAGIFSVPFSKKLVFSNRIVRMILVLISSGLCFTYGCYVIYHNLASF
jgi:hypothetical protein